MKIASLTKNSSFALCIILSLFLLAGCSQTKQKGFDERSKARATPDQTFGAATPLNTGATAHQVSPVLPKDGNISEGHAVFTIAGNASIGQAGTKIIIPAPRSFNLADSKDPLNTILPEQFQPKQNLYFLFTHELATSGKAKVVRTGGTYTEQSKDRALVIISALPEFMDENISDETFQSFKNDITRSAGTWSPENIKSFFHFANVYYSNRNSYTHSLGAVNLGPHSISIIRITKEPGTDKVRQLGQERIVQKPEEAMLATGVWKPEHIQAVLDESAKEVIALRNGKPLPEKVRNTAPEVSGDQYFKTASFTLSIQNIMHINGKCFNIYYNIPLKHAADIAVALEWDKAYIEEVDSFIERSIKPL